MLAIIDFGDARFRIFNRDPVYDRALLVLQEKYLLSIIEFKRPHTIFSN